MSELNTAEVPITTKNKCSAKYDSTAAPLNRLTAGT